MNPSHTRRAIPRLRWWIGGLLFASTVINYIDRQTLSVLAPFLKEEFEWTNSDFALIVIAFRIAYAFMQTVAGRFLDWLGTRRGLLITVTWYSTAAALTAAANGLRSFAVFRFLLGCGEAANWPGATKTVSEWFPKSERGWAVALFDSGSSVGGAIAPALVVWLYHTFGSWRPAFVITGLLGFGWVLVWRAFYHPPETHPRLGEDERRMLLESRREEQRTESRAIADSAQDRPASWGKLLSLPQTWGIILGRSLTDPVWFFITDWFAIFLVARGFQLESTLVGFWIPFLAADLGNFSGGGFSSYLIQRGWPVVKARKLVILVGGFGMALLIPVVLVSKFALIIGLFAVSTFSYAAWSTMALSLPSDLYPSRSVASVSGLSGTGAGVGTIISTYLIGWVSDRYSFEPVLIAGSMIPLVATALVFLLVRERRREEAVR
ncbi:MAG: MFS transporter [Bryobacteraceae bacterium]|nr:MFS transporter [Bryobacteraceae bacterium]